MNSAPSPYAAAAAAAAALAGRLAARWRAGDDPPDAAKALADHPELLRFKSVVIDLAYEEYCLREQRGERPDPDRLCARVPAFRSGVASVIRAHRLLAEHPEVLQAWPEPGGRAEGLDVVAELGRGGFARAYLAYDPEAARPCVLKLSPGRGAEGRRLGPLNHPHITGMYWTRTAAGGGTAVCLPLLGVTTLDDARDRAFGGSGGPPAGAVALLGAVEADATVVPPAPARPPLFDRGESYTAAAVAVLGRVADALAYLHAEGRAHGDLKPSNVILAPDAHPYLIDFNLSAGPDTGDAACGTPPYMAPELLKAYLGQPAASPDRPKADVYALGVVAFELLAGRHPWPTAAAHDPKRAAADILRGRDEHPAPAWPPGAEPPPAVAGVVARCLAESAADRPTAGEVRVALDSWLAATREKPRRRRRRAAAVAGLLFLLAAAFGVWWWVPREPTTADGHIRRGMARLNADDLDGALKDFEAARRLDPGPRPVNYRAYALVLRHERGADEAARFAFEKNPDNLAVRNNYAETLIRKGQWDQAIQHLDVVIAARPDWREARFNRANARLQADRKNPPSRKTSVAPSVADIRFVLETNPKSSDPHVVAAQVFAQNADTDPSLREEALEQLAAAILAGDHAKRHQGNPIFQGVFGQDPNFLRVLELPRGPAAPPDNLRVIEPDRP